MLGQNNEILSEGWSWEMLRRLWEQVRPDACSRCCLIQSQRLPGSKNNTRGILLGRLKTLKHSKIITCIPYTYHLHIIYIGRDPYISVRGHQIDLWFQNLPIFREERVQVCDQKCSTWVKEIQNPNVCNAMIATRQRRLPLLSLSVGRRPLVRLEGGLDALH